MNDITRYADHIDVNELQAVSKLLAMSGYFEAKGNNDAAIAQIATKVLAGREMGFGPFTSVQGIYIIQGRPAVGANLIASAIKAHPAYDYRVLELTEAVCTIEFFQLSGGKRESLGKSTFTADDARRAGTKNMDKFARNMLFARCISNGHRWYCPDVFNGNAVYVPEELGADVDGDGNVISAPRVVNVTTGEIVTQPAPAKVNGNGKAATPSEGIRRALHARGAEIFGDEWDAARHWMVGAWTAKHTPGNVRHSAALLTDEEMKSISNDMNDYADAILRRWQAYQATTAVTVESSPELAP